MVYCERVQKIGTCSARLPAWGTTLVLVTLASGCAPSVSAPTGIRLDGIKTSVGLRPKLSTKAYMSADRSTADIYLSDLPEAALQTHASLAGVSGTIVHVHLFTLPKAGKTPIDDTASTATVRTLVVSNGHLGVYGGGGFMMPSGRPGGKSMGGSIRAASVRLTGTTPGFDDKMGAAEFSATVSAPLDEPRARIIASRFEELVRMTTPVAVGTPDKVDEKITTDSFGVPLDPASPRGQAEADAEEANRDEAPPAPARDPIPENQVPKR